MRFEFEPRSVIRNNVNLMAIVRVLKTNDYDETGLGYQAVLRGDTVGTECKYIEVDVYHLKSGQVVAQSLFKSYEDVERYMEFMHSLTDWRRPLHRILEEKYALKIQLEAFSSILDQNITDPKTVENLICQARSG